MLKIPVDFQNLANAANGGQKWHSISLLWDFTVQRNSLWATKASQWPAKPWAQAMINTMSQIREAFTKANRANRRYVQSVKAPLQRKEGKNW